jgi:hypothetical protein
MPRRDELTFSQADGLEPLPAPLRLGELPETLRNDIFNIVVLSLSEGVDDGELFGSWREAIFLKHTKFDHRPVDELDLRYKTVKEELKRFIIQRPYNNVFDLLQFLVRQEGSPRRIIEFLNRAFEEHQAAYRFIGTSIMPVATEQEGATLRRAFADMDGEEFGGARAHLRAAGAALSGGRAGDSVRESIHAVESVVRALTGKPKATLSDALSLLKAETALHPAFELGLHKLYAYTNDEGGIRHALNAEDARVDEADALFMLGACASFVSYIIGKARKLGLIRNARNTLLILTLDPPPRSRAPHVRVRCAPPASAKITKLDD